MTRCVIDASVAVKWVVEEPDTPAALALLRRARLLAPELLTAECANILWKKQRRRELSREEVFLAARLLQAAAVEYLPTRHLLEGAARLAVELDHPAYDCLYLALASEQRCHFVSADVRFLHKTGASRWRGAAIGLAAAAELPGNPAGNPD